MKIITPSVELIDDIDSDAVYKKIERCGRVCYQSKRPMNSYGASERAEDFIRMLIKRGHESVLEHVNLTFHIICDRAIMAELTRHRLASFSVESTRYCKYNELTFVGNSLIHSLGTNFVNLKRVEQIYLDATYNGLFSPEQARAVLPLCLKSELYMTANLREWRHILKLRTSEKAHPQMRFIANHILNIFKEKLPVIVEDFQNA